MTPQQPSSTTPYLQNAFNTVEPHACPSPWQPAASGRSPPTLCAAPPVPTPTTAQRLLSLILEVNTRLNGVPTLALISNTQKIDALPVCWFLMTIQFGDGVKSFLMFQFIS
jgi:hypothetical protein